MPRKSQLEKDIKKITIKELASVLGTDSVIHKINEQIEPIRENARQYLARYFMFQEQFRDPEHRIFLPLHEEDVECGCYDCVDKNFQNGCAEIQEALKEYEERIESLKE